MKFVLAGIQKRYGYSASNKSYYEIPVCIVLNAFSSRPSTVDHNARAGTHLVGAGYTKTIELPVEPAFFPALEKEFNENQELSPVPFLIDLETGLSTDGKTLITGFSDTNDLLSVTSSKSSDSSLKMAALGKSAAA